MHLSEILSFSFKNWEDYYLALLYDLNNKESKLHFYQI